MTAEPGPEARGRDAAGWTSSLTCLEAFLAAA